MVQLNVKKLIVKDVACDSTIAIIAPRRSGKSFLIRDILYHKRKQLNYGVVFCGTENFNHFYKSFIPSTYIYETFDSKKLENIVNKQKIIIANNGKRDDNRMFIVFDDILQEEKLWKKDKTVLELFFNGRHLNIMFIISIQYPLGLSPSMRMNIDFTFFFNESQDDMVRKYFTYFSRHFKNYNDFRKAFTDVCAVKQYRTLVVNTESIMCYLADDRRNFTVGSPDFWKYHIENYNENYFLNDMKRR